MSRHRSTVRLLAILWVVFCGFSGTYIQAAETHSRREIPSLGPVGEVELIQSGFKFLEGPAKVPDGRIFFTDIPDETIYQLDVEGKVSQFLRPSGHANGLMYGGSGQLLVCQMDGFLSTVDIESRQLTVLAGSYENSRFNAPNDLVIDREGGIYFTDPRYRAPNPWPQTVEAFYYRSKDGQVTRLGDGMLAPNGIALSPDEKTLYVIPSMQSNMMAFPVENSGKIGDGRVFCQLQQVGDQTDGGGDGLAVDVNGNVYITSAAGIQIFSDAGELLGIIEVPEQPANCAFGGPDNKTLYMTARTGLYRCTMPVAGHLQYTE